MNLFPNRVIVRAEITVDGRRYAAQVGLEADAWDDPLIQERVKAELRAHLVTELIDKWAPKIRIQPVM